MPRKKSPIPRQPVKIDEDLARKVGVLAAASGKSVAEWLSVYLRPLLVAEMESFVTREHKRLGTRSTSEG